jgi:hypothetical protein
MDEGACLWSDEVRTCTVVWSDEERENEESGYDGMQRWLNNGEAAPGVNTGSDDDVDEDEEIIVAWPVRVVKVRSENGR